MSVIVPLLKTGGTEGFFAQLAVAVLVAPVDHGILLPTAIALDGIGLIRWDLDRVTSPHR
jgi:hypothetical protein